MKTPSQLSSEYYASDISIEEFARLVQEDALDSAAEVIGDIIRSRKTEGKRDE